VSGLEKRFLLGDTIYACKLRAEIQAPRDPAKRLI
jgi:hypothetical protein